MKRSDHKLNALLPNGQNVPYNLRSCKELPIPRANTNRYINSFNSVVFGILSERLTSILTDSLVLLSFLIYFRIIIV